jgi:glycosyltransferase involved in cell wall biosynthesis
MRQSIFIEAKVFTGEFQGSRTYLKEIYLEAVERNPNHLFIFASIDAEILNNLFGHLSNVRIIKYRSKSSLFRFFVEIPWLIRSLGCNYAHFQYIIPIIRSKGCKYLVTIHDVLFLDYPHFFPKLYSEKRKYLFNYSARNSDYLLTVSEYSKQRIADLFRIPDTRILVTPNGVSGTFVNFRVAKEKSAEYVFKKYHFKKYLLYVSRIEERKNQRLLLEWFVLNRMWSFGYVLVFVGNDTLRSGFDSLISSLNSDAKASIKWFRKLPDDELLHFYNAAECFVYPSKAEGFGIPVLEAGVLETPVVCSDKTAMREFDFFGLKFDPDDMEDFNRVLEVALSVGLDDTSLIRKEIMLRYTWENAAKVISNILSS